MCVAICKYKFQSTSSRATTPLPVRPFYNINELEYVFRLCLVITVSSDIVHKHLSVNDKFSCQSADSEVTRFTAFLLLFNDIGFRFGPTDMSWVYLAISLAIYSNIQGDLGLRLANAIITIKAPSVCYTNVFVCINKKSYAFPRGQFKTLVKYTIKF